MLEDAAGIRRVVLACGRGQASGFCINAWETAACHGHAIHRKLRSLRKDSSIT